MAPETMRTWPILHRYCVFFYLKSLFVFVIVASVCTVMWLARGVEINETASRSSNDNMPRTSYRDKPCEHLPIDVVYTWVNGTDPVFQDNLRKYEQAFNLKKAESRFHNKNELKYSLRSLAMYAPWIRHVYVVTNGQIPDWLNLDNPRLTLVTHDDIFPDKADLPTFSSGAIEVHIHRIPGLSDKFLYFNDDVFLGKEIWPEDFVTHANGQKVYLSYYILNCSLNCDWTKLGNGKCDSPCNTRSCGFDGGDCPVAHPSDSLETVMTGSIEPKTRLATHRNDVDMYGKSLIYVNSLYGKLYGYQRRKAPAHIPHLLDKSIVNDMQTKFATEFRKTSTHRTRNSQDMQLSFSYFHYLINEKRNITIGEIFDEFDTDMSGTLSTGEVRTLLTRLYPLPLTNRLIIKFEKIITDCFDGRKFMMAQPFDEDYITSSRLIVSRELILDCPLIGEKLVKKFGHRSRYNHEIVESGEDYFFLMLKSTLSGMGKLFDEIRSKTKKFVCVNDDLDPYEPLINERLLALLDDFYLTLFPFRSTFELPSGEKNRFAYRSELLEWQAGQTRVRNIAIIIVVAIFSIGLCYVFHNEVQRLFRISLTRITGSVISQI